MSSSGPNAEERYARHDGFRIPFSGPDDAGTGRSSRQPVVTRPSEIDAGAGIEPQQESVGEERDRNSAGKPGGAVAVNIDVQHG